MLSFILILTITACSNSTESNDEAITDDAVTTETQDNNSVTADTTKEPTRIYPSTYYQAVLTSGDVELVAYFSLSNFTTGGEILESDPITVNKCEYTLEGNALTLETNLSFDDAGSISVSTDKYSLSGYAISDVDFFYDLRAVEDFSPISNGYLTINK